MKIPFVDLKAQYQTIKKDIDVAIEKVISETAFIKGKYVSQFEDEFRDMYGTDHFISCANGTDAIFIALKSAGIGLGDEVITVANTWISSAETISQVGARPVFIDINRDYYTIDVEKIEAKITSRTKAIIAVHLFGQPCDMDAIGSICKKHNLFLLEDCAQAHFAEWKGKRVGTFGDVGTFSFFPGKNLGAYGDAGGIVTNNEKLANQMRMYANHGALKKHEHLIEGINSRLDGIQGAILSAKLPHIHSWNQSRYRIASDYIMAFKKNHHITLPKIPGNVKHVFHLFVIQVENREGLIKHLSANGISTGIHYPTPLPYLKAFQYLKHVPSDFPVSYSIKDKILSLPLYPELNQSQFNKVINTISEYYHL
jgi:dTDP-4-amino-4,6-dideoxygalactose transaminase